MEDNLVITQQKQFIKSLVTVRRRQNMSQTELAEATDILRSNIVRFESGKTNPTLQTLLKITIALGVKITIGD